MYTIYLRTQLTTALSKIGKLLYKNVPNSIYLQDMKRQREDAAERYRKRQNIALGNTGGTYYAGMPRFARPPAKQRQVIMPPPRLMQPSANRNQNKSETKMVDCYFSSTVAPVGAGVAPNPIDVYSVIGGSNSARNVFPGIEQGTARSQRIGSKCRAKYLDIYAELQTNSEKEGDTFRVSLCKVNRNGGNNGASYGGLVYGSSSNAGGIGLGSGMEDIFWPRNEDHTNDFSVLREWDVNTLSKGLTMIGDPGSAVERFTLNVAIIKDHVNLNYDLMQWEYAATNGDITGSLETMYFILVRRSNRQADDSSVVFKGGIRIGFVDT